MNNLKLFYLAAFDKNKSSGVEKKIITQIDNLSNLNVVVNRIGWTKGNNQVSCFIEKIKILFHIISSSRKTKNKTVLYIRGCFNYILCLSLVLLKPCGLKIAFELQSIQSKEFKNANYSNNLWCLMSILKSRIDSFFVTLILNSSDAIVSVTSEINQWYKRLTHNKLNYLVLGNGISTSSLPVSRRPKTMEELNVICVANVDVWHGVDRFIRGLHEYQSSFHKTPIVFHIVGDGPALPDLRKLVVELNLQDKVIFHGFKSGKDLDEIFDMCHVAMDALAGSRKGLTELSSLKSREYCTRGIPFIVSSKDFDFPENWEYMLKIPDDEKPVNMNMLIGFSNRIMADSEHPQKMHKYAAEYLDWTAKMVVLKDFLNSL